MSVRKDRYNSLINDIIKDYSGGMGKIKICKKYNIAIQTLNNWLKRNDGKILGEIVINQHGKEKEEKLKKEKEFQKALLRIHGDINNNLHSIKGSTEVKGLIDDIAALKSAIKDIARLNMQLIEKITAEE